jgi:hypothetical protein
LTPSKRRRRIVDKEQIVSIILEECKKLQDMVNNVYFKKLVRMHNVDDEYNFINAKQELIAERGYFPGPKKKYVLHIINEEGVPVNKKDIKGLTTKRSDYSKLTRDSISKLLDLLVMDDTTSFSKIRKFIDDTTKMIEDIIDKRHQQIGKPVSYSKAKEKYKRIPPHIIGMEMWNKLEYNYFVPGTKGYMFPMIGVDTNMITTNQKNILDDLPKSNYIVLPQDVETLPVHYIIDVDDLLGFSWTNRVNELIDPIRGFIYKETPKDLTLEW